MLNKLNYSEVEIFFFLLVKSNLSVLKLGY